MMKKYLSMLLFVVVMGAVSVGVLMGADFLTRDLIEKNSEFVWKSAILEHHEIAHTQADFVEIFEASFNTLQTPEDAEEQFTVFENKETGNVSYRFFGMGLWDAIEGVITLETDWKTIVSITVTKQAETPGLGGVVAERNYLNNYVGKEFNDNLEILVVKGGATENYEVDAITGATGTSNAFGKLLTANYRKFIFAMTDRDASMVWKQAMLANNGVEYTDENYADVFSATFTVTTSNGLKLYTNKVTGSLNFIFEGTGKWGPIKSVLTLETDFVTIKKVSVYEQVEQWGGKIQTNPAILAPLVGYKFTDPRLDQLDGMTGSTETKDGFLDSLYSSYALYFETFGGNA